ncbi:MAG: hypothetical protein IJ739_05275, partial [Bacteroidaceae bacterium]|nr:hypothetical protein [Bacteroidaceae bacterium]
HAGCGARAAAAGAAGGHGVVVVSFQVVNEQTTFSAAKVIRRLPLQGCPEDLASIIIFKQISRAQGLTDFCWRPEG